jgi:hypothetical protein
VLETPLMQLRKYPENHRCLGHYWCHMGKDSESTGCINAVGDNGRAVRYIKASSVSVTMLTKLQKFSGISDSSDKGKTTLVKPWIVKTYCPVYRDTFLKDMNNINK